MYADPRGRRTLIDEAMVDQRNVMRGVQQHVGFTDEEWQRLLEVKAEQSSGEARGRRLRCRADPDCQSPLSPEQMASNQQAVSDAVGEDKYAAYDAVHEIDAGTAAPSRNCKRTSWVTSPCHSSAPKN